MFMSSTCSPHASDSKRKRTHLFDANISKDGSKLGSKLRMKIIHSGKLLEPFFLLVEVCSSHVKIPGIDVVIRTTFVPVIPIQSTAPLPSVTNDIKEHLDSSHAKI